MFIAELTTYGQSVASSQVTIDGIILISEYVNNIDSADLSQAVLDIDACGSINKNSGSVRVIDTSSNVYAIRTILFYTLSGSAKKVVAGYSQEESFVLKTAGVLNVLLPFDFSVFTSGFLFATVQSGYSNAAHNTDGVLHIENPDTNADDNYSVYSKTQVDDLISDVSYTAGDGISLSNNVIKTTGIPFGICDSTSTSTKFTVTVPGIYKLEDGVTCMVKNGVVTSASGFTLNVNGLGAKPCYTNLAASTRETTIFSAAYTMLFVYDSTRVSGGCWICYRGYDSNTNSVGYQLRTNSTVMNVSDTARYYKLYFTSADGNLWVPASVNSTNDATTARAVNQRPINPFGRIVYTSASTNYATGANLAATTIWDQYNLALGYSFNVNGGALTLTAEKPVYVKCAPQTDGSAIIDATNPTVQDLPTSNDGKIYIFLGTATSATAVELFQNHPVYYHDGNGIKLWSGVVLPSKTSDLTNDSGFITEEDIPTNVSAFNNDAGYLTSYTETDPTVPAWAKQATKPSYTLDEVTDGSTRKLSNYVPTTRKVNNKALSSDITLNLDDVLDGSTRKLNNYIPYSEVISTINGFDNRRLWQYEIHNTLWAANKRYDVTLTGFSNNNAAASLFDGSFETNVVVPKSGTGVILISGKNNTKMWGGGYPYGYLEVAFYYTNVPESVTCRVYSDWTQNPGWHDVTLTNVCKNSNQALYRGVNTSFYGVTQVEITVNAKDSVTANVTEVAFYQTRGTLQQMSVFNKTVAQTLYHDLTGTKFIVSGGTSSQFLKADGSLDSSAYITSASIPTNVSAFNNDAGYLTSHQSLSSVVASAQYNSTSKKIEFYNPSGTKLNTDIDASAFIKDGMVDTVEVSGGNLVITFNTDAGKEDIEIPISDIFDANNYYTKAQVDGLIPTVNNAKLTIKKNASDTGTEFTANASTNVTCNLGLATVATSGSYNDLSNKPTIPTVNNTTITIKKNTSDAGDSFTTNTATAKTINLGLSTVASSGSYNDLSNKPTIPTVNNSTITIKKNSDDTGDSFTTNASSGKTINLGLATVATSGSYNDLSNKPTIPTVNNATLTIQKNGTTVKTFTANASSNVTANITVPLESISVDGTAQTITNKNVDLHIPDDIYSSDFICSMTRTNVSGSGNLSLSGIVGPFPVSGTPMPVGTYRIRIRMRSTTSSYSLTVNFGGSYTLTSSSGVIDDIRTVTLSSASTFSASVTQVNANTYIKVSIYEPDVIVTDVGVAAVTNDYNDLENIPNGTLIIQRNGSNVASFSASATSNVTANITVPTTTSQLTNNSGFITSADLPTNHVTTDTAQTISGSKSVTSLIHLVGRHNSNTHGGLKLSDTSDSTTFTEIASSTSDTVSSQASVFLKFYSNSSYVASLDTTFTNSSSGVYIEVEPSADNICCIGTSTNRFKYVHTHNLGSSTTYTDSAYITDIYTAKSSFTDSTSNFTSIIEQSGYNFIVRASGALGSIRIGSQSQDGITGSIKLTEYELELDCNSSNTYNVLPKTASCANLGSESKPFDHVYANNLGSESKPFDYAYTNNINSTSITATQATIDEVSGSLELKSTDFIRFFKGATNFYTKITQGQYDTCSRLFISGYEATNDTPQSSLIISNSSDPDEESSIIPTRGTWSLGGGNYFNSAYITNIYGTSFSGNSATATSATSATSATYATYIRYASSGSTYQMYASSATVLRPTNGSSVDIGTSTYKYNNIYAVTFNGDLDGNATSATNAAHATDVVISIYNEDTNYPIVITDTGGATYKNLAKGTATYNPSTNTLSCTTFSGSLSGNATSATSAAAAANVGILGNSSNSSYPLVFTNSVNTSTSSVVNKKLYTDTANALSYNPSTNVLSGLFAIPYGSATLSDSTWIVSSVTPNPTTSSDPPTGAVVSVYFNNYNSVENPQLKFGSWNAKPIYRLASYAGTGAANSWLGGSTVLLRYTGSNWRLLNNNSYPTSTASGTTNIIPSADNTYDLGSSSYRWNNLYAYYVGDSSTKIQYGYFNYCSISTLRNGSNSNLATLTSAGIIPYTDSTSSSTGFDLGSSTRKWKHFYISGGHDSKYIIVDSSGGEPTIRPDTPNYGYLGTSSADWYRIYGRQIHVGSNHVLIPPIAATSNTSLGSIQFLRVAIPANTTTGIVNAGTALSSSSYTLMLVTASTGYSYLYFRNNAAPSGTWTTLTDMYFYNSGSSTVYTYVLAYKSA